MSVLAEAVLATFDSNTDITWTTRGLDTVVASFIHEGATVLINFSRVAEQWQVGFSVNAPDKSMEEGVQSGVKIFGGVFQAIREFLEVRQPMTLVFASKTDPLGELYENYLKRQGNALTEMGYQMASVKSSPLTEFTIRKTTPSEWRE